MSVCTIVGLWLFIAALCCSTTATADNRIVNGVLATTGKYPYQASLQTVAGNTHFCGGSILKTRWIVTAAHCLDNRVAADIKVVVGTLTLTGGTSYLVTRFVQHSSYVASTRIYDAAIVQTTTAIVFSATVKALRLANIVPIAGVSGVVTGWGSTVLNGPVSNDLGSLSTKVISNSECTTKLAATTTTVQSTHICTYTASSGACGLDDGGPIVEPLGFQFGIVSYPSCSQNLPDVYTSVPSVYFWIMKNAI